MELIQEIFVTVAVAILLSFLVAKFVSMAMSGDGGGGTQLKSGEVVGSKISTPATAVMKEFKFGEKLSVGGLESAMIVDEIVMEKTKKVVEYESDRESEVVKLFGNLSEGIHGEKLVVMERVSEVIVDGNSKLQENLLKENTSEEESKLVQFPENLSAKNTGEEVVVMDSAGEMIVEEFSKLPEDLSTEITREETNDVEFPETLSTHNSDKEEVVVMEKDCDFYIDVVATERVGEVTIEESSELQEKNLKERKSEEKSKLVDSPEIFSVENSGDAASAQMNSTGDCEIKNVKEGEVDETSLESTLDDVVGDQIEEIGVLRRTEPGKEKEHLIDEDDDWEGIERTELEKEFAVAATFVGGGRLGNVGSDVQMQLYGLHKVATEGQCYDPQPMALKISARALWNAWQRQGNMTPEVAMEKYIALLTENVPGWIEDNNNNAIGETGKDVIKAGTPIALEPDMQSSRGAVVTTGGSSTGIIGENE